MEDRHSRPLTSPIRTTLEVERQILDLRRANQWGLPRPGYELRVPRSTVGRVLDRPQTNGKVERFNRNLLHEWAYASAYDSDEARSATYQDWIHWYNHYRHHTGIGGLTPAQRVHNLTGNYT